jgi:hypothetical protein
MPETKTTPVEPSYAERERCLAIRRRSKTGSPPSEDELRFLEEMRTRYRDWYVGTEGQVFRDTAPFGSRL